MRAPEWLDIKRTPERDTPRTVGYTVTLRNVTHACPMPGDGGLMPCCGQTPFEVPRWHRMTQDAALVTCALASDPTHAQDADGGRG